jgi:hypothetical protein
VAESGVDEIEIRRLRTSSREETEPIMVPFQRAIKAMLD